MLDLGRPDEALPILVDDLALCVQTLAVGNNVRCAVATNLIDAYLGVDRPADAEHVARELLAERRGQSQSRAGSIAQTVDQLGLAQFAQGDFEDAGSSFEECILLRESIDPDHWLTHRARSHLGATLAERSQFEQAEVLLIEAAMAIGRKQGDITPNMGVREVAEARRQVARMYAARGRSDRAERWRMLAAGVDGHGP